MGGRRLEGQVALVTGASQGIGLLIATELAGRGMSVVGLARDPERLRAAMDQVTATTGAPAVVAAGDVTRPEDVDAAVARSVTEFGGIDLLVNAAGLVDAAEVPVWQADPDQWWAVVSSHVRGTQLTIRAEVPVMLARHRGRVVNLVSGMGTRAEPDYSAYSVGKAAQIRLTEALALSLKDTGVYAFNIAPGLVRTPMTASMPKWDGHTNWTPQERVVELVCSVAAGELDAWSGRFLRAGVDQPEEVRDLIPVGSDRQLRLRAYGPDDPMG